MVPKALVPLFCLLPLTGFSAMAEDWLPYHNGRFGTYAEVPSAFMAGEEPGNGDGLKFFDTGSDGEISVYGAFNVMGDDLASYRDFLIEIDQEGGWDIEMLKTGDRWFTFSASRGDRLLFLRAQYGEGCSAELFHHIEFRYPASDHQRWEPYILHGVETLDGPC